MKGYLTNFNLSLIVNKRLLQKINRLKGQHCTVLFTNLCRNKTITLERLKRSIVNEVRSGDQEGRCLAQYKREMELLQQEKMSHVEELRQIHADINAVSNLTSLNNFWL